MAFLPLIVEASGHAFADEGQSVHSGFLKGYTLSAYENEYDWRHEADDYKAPVTTQVLEDGALESGALTSNANDKLSLNQDKDKRLDKNEAEDLAENILENMPYSRQLKSTWHLLDGDTDLYVDGLRVDRGNRGVSYQTSTVPFMGEVEGVRFKAEAGKDSKLKFESSVIPFVGHIEGFKFKTSVGEDSQVSVRYNVPLERLGL